MNKKWLTTLAGDIEAKYGKEARERIFGDIGDMKNDHQSLSAWFDNFITGMDELNDKKFLQQMMANRCPCGGDDEENGKAMREFYDNSKTPEDFVDLFGKWLHKKYNGDVDTMALCGNVLYMIKPWKKSHDANRCGEGCHCGLAMHTEKVVSDIFCYCCTIGHTGRMFQAAFGGDIKMEFVESIITGGKECTMAVHLPEKNT